LQFVIQVRIESVVPLGHDVLDRQPKVGERPGEAGAELRPLLRVQRAGTPGMWAT